MNAAWYIATWEAHKLLFSFGQYLEMGLVLCSIHFIMDVYWSDQFGPTKLDRAKSDSSSHMLSAHFSVWFVFCIFMRGLSLRIIVGVALNGKHAVKRDREYYRNNMERPRAVVKQLWVLWTWMRSKSNKRLPPRVNLKVSDSDWRVVAEEAKKLPAITTP